MSDEETERCEGCGRPAVTADSDGVPLCRECADACDESEREIAVFMDALRPHFLPGTDENVVANDLRGIIKGVS